MTLKDLTVTLATAEKLRKAGFPQDCALTWERPILGNRPYVSPRYGDKHPWPCAAPTLAEVLAELPAVITTDAHGDGYETDYHRSVWARADGREIVSYLSADDEVTETLPLWIRDANRIGRHRDAEETHENPAEAAALLWLSLHAAGLVRSSAPAGGER